MRIIEELEAEIEELKLDIKSLVRFMLPIKVKHFDRALTNFTMRELTEQGQVTNDPTPLEGSCA